MIHLNMIQLYSNLQEKSIKEARANKSNNLKRQKHIVSIQMRLRTSVNMRAKEGASGAHSDYVVL